ncbi:serine/threonine-protein kinase [Streptomyces sp. LHD-70]|uniref:serine/threonine-protein kinase n=1 Tax=Streptomyces sp. LHD-70 TaxID=3072140 RepID=UPI00280D506E|nr:serine/threonine-protein kinase [Streptomyces sp. LHD-70]MDQ8701465.1 serine/threonine-protein kinase [Streptomyces sp. LHD-70]
MGSTNDDRNGGPGRIEPLSELDPPSIGPYRLLGRLGAGGMGRVYLARSEGGRTVAVKVVHEEHTSDRQFRARFRREIRAARRVGEDFTAPVLDADPDAPRPWVATGYVPGLSLEEVVREYGPLPAKPVHALADGLLRALRGIHDADIVHRDLKPSNVMLTVEGPRVIDFGIARAVQTSVESLLTSTGMAIGSPGFMAPEQVLAEEAGPRADVFALGCVLTYAVTGRLAFGQGAGNQHALMYRIVEAEPDLELVQDASLRTLIARCLTKKVDERPDVAELLADPSRPRPSSRRGAWLPGEVVAQLAHQSARLLDVEAPTPASGSPVVTEEPEAEAQPGAETEAEAKPEAEAELEPEAEPEPEPAATTPRPEPRATATATTAKAPPHKRRTWLVLAAVLAVLATGSTVYLIDRDAESSQASPDPGGAAPKDPGSTPTSPGPTKSNEGAKAKDDEKGKEEKGKDGAGGGAAAGSGSDGSDAGGAPDPEADAPAGGGGADSGDGGSGGGSGSGSGGEEAASGGVPSYFIGSWKPPATYNIPSRIEIEQASDGQQAVSFIRNGPEAGGGSCVAVARLISVENGGSRLNLDTAKIDPARSTSYGCMDEKPSYIDSSSPSGIKWFKSKTNTSDNNAWTYTRS